MNAGAACSLDNGQGSFVWQLPDMVELCEDPRVFEATVAYCACGKACQKRIRIISNMPSIVKLTRKCKCKEGHKVILEGSKCTAASKYPARLVKKWTQLIADNFA